MNPDRMNSRLTDPDRRLHLAHSRIALGAAMENLDPMIEVLREMAAGYPTGHEGGGQATVCPTCKGSTSVEGDLGLAELCGDCEGRGWVTDQLDRTEAAALNPDKARKDLNQLDYLVRRLRSVTDELDGLRQFWLTTTSDKPIGQVEPGCRSCRRLRVTINGNEVPMWEPRRELPNSTREKPRYDERCQWCADWFRSEETEPPLVILRLRHQGTKITEQLLARHGVKTKGGSARERRSQKKAS